MSTIYFIGIYYKLEGSTLNQFAAFTFHFFSTKCIMMDLYVSDLLPKETTQKANLEREMATHLNSDRNYDQNAGLVYAYTDDYTVE